MDKSTQSQIKSKNLQKQSQNTPEITEPSPWFNLAEAAKYIKLNKRTLANYVSKGLVPVHISPVGGKRFHKKELDQWISSTRRGFLP
ncbi:MAG: helix-turn-helix domain-containing protein [Desulfamplus sp.]|nr:helix-turn-helix domain-containing protein [Desulfamplus sp.]